MINTKSFRLAPVLVLIGEVVSTVIVLYIHPGGGETIEATFMNYAASRYWVAIHLAQFCGTAILLAGVLTFFHILKVLDGVPHWLGFFGSIAALLGLALAGVVFAVDGVANKSAVDAWATAPSRPANPSRHRRSPTLDRDRHNQLPGHHVGAGRCLVRRDRRLDGQASPVHRFSYGPIWPRLHRRRLARRDTRLHRQQYRADRHRLRIPLPCNDLGADPQLETGAARAARRLIPGPNQDVRSLARRPPAYGKGQGRRVSKRTSGIALLVHRTAVSASACLRTVSELSFFEVLLSGRHEQMMIKCKVQWQGIALAACKHC